MSRTRRDNATRRRLRRALGSGVVVALAAVVLSGCVIYPSFVDFTDSTLDCVGHTLQVATKTGQTFEEVVGVADDQYDDTVVRWDVTESWFDREDGHRVLASGEITVGDFKHASSFTIPIADTRIQNPVWLTLWNGTSPITVGVAGCPEADIQTMVWTDADAVDNTLPVFSVESVLDLRIFDSLDTSLIQVGGTAEPAFAIAPDPGTPQHYYVTITGVEQDGTITVSVPPGFVVDKYGATNRSTVSATMTLDRTPPALAPVSDIDAGYAALGASDKVVEFATPTATDLHLAGAASCTPASGSAFPIGTTTVTCTATDLAGNTSSTQFDVSVAAAPRTPETLTISGPTTATEGDTATFTVEAFNSQGESLGAPTGITLSSDVPSDAASGDEVVFGFDPAAIGGSSTHTITATLDDDPAVRATASVDVASAVASIGIRAPGGGAPSVGQHGSLTFAVDAFDADGRLLGDAGRGVVLSSDVPSDVIDGTRVTFPHASPHRITATAVGDPSLTASVVVEVVPAQVPARSPLEGTAASPAAIAETGMTDAAPLLATATAAVLAGALLLLVVRRRVPS